VIGVAAADSSRAAVFTAAAAGLVAGAMSMAAGEYISVSSQRDAERADESLEAAAIEENHLAELRELARIYETRGVEPGLARLVAEQLMVHDPVGAHMRDELGITETSSARPVQAAWTSALAFTIGALLPVLAMTIAPQSVRIAVTAVTALSALVALGVTGARLGGAPWPRAVVRVVAWSSLAMALTFAVGSVVGANV